MFGRTCIDVMKEIEDPETPGEKVEDPDPSKKNDSCVCCALLFLFFLLLVVIIITVVYEPLYLVFSETRFETIRQQKWELIEKEKTMEKMMDQMYAIERKVIQLQRGPGENWKKWTPIPSEFVGYNEFLDKFGSKENYPFLYGYHPKIDDVTKDGDLFPMIKKNLHELVNKKCYSGGANFLVKDETEIKNSHLFVNLSLATCKGNFDMTFVYKSILSDL